MSDRSMLAILALILVLLAGIDLHADEATTDQLDAAILYLVTVGFPEHEIYPRPNSPIVRDQTRRDRLTAAILSAATEMHVDPWLMLAIAFREGSFIGAKTGEIGERSTFQITKSAVDWLHRRGYTSCTLDTVEGSAVCCAALLHEHGLGCGDKRGALLYYATGRTCTADTKKLAWLAWDRLTLARKLGEL